MKKPNLILTGIIALMVYTSCETENTREFEDMTCKCYKVDSINNEFENRDIEDFLDNYRNNIKSYLVLVNDCDEQIILNTKTVSSEWITTLLNFERYNTQWTCRDK